MHRSTTLIVLAAAVATVLLLTLAQRRADAHCEIPCGIYDDHARIAQMLEDTSTIAKAAAQITQLSGRHDPEAIQQTIRWTVNKEDHATRIQHTIAQYFMTQRIKPTQEDYVERLTRHHAVLLAAMKTKQTVDPRAVQALRDAIDAVAPYYPAHTHPSTAPEPGR